MRVELRQDDTHILNHRLYAVISLLYLALPICGRVGCSFLVIGAFQAESHLRNRRPQLIHGSVEIGKHALLGAWHNRSLLLFTFADALASHKTRASRRGSEYRRSAEGRCFFQFDFDNVERHVQISASHSETSLPFQINAAFFLQTLSSPDGAFWQHECFLVETGRAVAA